MKVAVIGGGLAALAACRALIACGVTPDVIEPGFGLPDPFAAAVKRMRAVDPKDWHTEDRLMVGANATISEQRIPKKLSFGSDYFFSGQHGDLHTQLDSDLVATSAAGGTSVAWGACVLPPHADDMAHWPVSRDAFASAARRVRKWLPIAAGADDALEDQFPLFGPAASALPMSNAALQFARAWRSDGAAFLERARLAVDPTQCRQCGICLTGCPYGAIYSAEPAFKKLAKAGEIRALAGVSAVKLNEVEAHVHIDLQDSDGQSQGSHTYDRVFLAAGVLNSTHILLRSLNLLNQPVTLKSAQKFVAPMLRRQSHAVQFDQGLELADLFLDYPSATLGGRWMHLQITGPNQLLAQKLGANRRGPRGALGRIALRHMLILWGGLHSNNSGSIRAVAQIDSESQGRTVLNVTDIPHPQISVALRASLQEIRGVIGSAAWIPPLSASLAGVGSGNHCGSSFPMMAKVDRPTASDTLGRPGGLQRVHLVDTSVLPDIPATTIAMPTMALADYIATTALSQL